MPPQLNGLGVTQRSLALETVTHSQCPASIPAGQTPFCFHIAYSDISLSPCLQQPAAFTPMSGQATGFTAYERRQAVSFGAVTQRPKTRKVDSIRQNHSTSRERVTPRGPAANETQITINSIGFTYRKTPDPSMWNPNAAGNLLDLRSSKHTMLQRPEIEHVPIEIKLEYVIPAPSRAVGDVGPTPTQPQWCWFRG